MNPRNDDFDDRDRAEWDEEPDEQDSPDEGLDLERELSAFDSSPALAERADGSGSVILSGPGAGTNVAAPPEGTKKLRFPIRSRDSALTSGVPLFIVHSPHQKRSLMPRLIASVIAATRGSVSTAAAVGLPKGTNESLSDWLQSCAAASIRMADPLGYMLDPTIVKVRGVSAQSLRWRPYLGNPSLDVAQVLQTQREVGANLMLTSGRALDHTAPQPALDTAFMEGDDALAELLPGERLALNLTLPAAWLSNATLRSKLFGQLLDQEQFDIWHIRVQWPSSLRSMHQPVDEELLTGYKRLSQLAADEGRILMLPQTGLTGWLQLAFGSTGFGSGLFGAGQAFKEQSQRGGGGQPEIERYFEPTLLHPVERVVHDAMRAKTSYIPCDCPYCPALHAKPQWDHDLARLHLMHWQGRLAGVASARKKPQEAAVRHTVRTAVQAAANAPLAGISAPRHLQAWDRLL